MDQLIFGIMAFAFIAGIVLFVTKKNKKSAPEKYNGGNNAPAENNDEQQTL